MNKKYLALISRIEEELSDLKRITKRIIEGWRQTKQTEREAES